MDSDRQFSVLQVRVLGPLLSVHVLLRCMIWLRIDSLPMRKTPGYLLLFISSDAKPKKTRCFFFNKKQCFFFNHRPKKTVLWFFIILYNLKAGKCFLILWGAY